MLFLLIVSNLTRRCLKSAIKHEWSLNDDCLLQNIVHFMRNRYVQVFKCKEATIMHSKMVVLFKWAVFAYNFFNMLFTLFDLHQNFTAEVQSICEIGIVFRLNAPSSYFVIIYNPFFLYNVKRIRVQARCYSYEAHCVSIYLVQRAHTSLTASSTNMTFLTRQQTRLFDRHLP